MWRENLVRSVVYVIQLLLLLLLTRFSHFWPCATHRWQPTRLPCPWDSQGKNTGVGCHFLLQCMKVKSQSEVTQSCLTLKDPVDCSLPGSSIHGIFQATVLEWGAIAFWYYLAPGAKETVRPNLLLLFSWPLVTGGCSRTWHYASRWTLL